MNPFNPQKVLSHVPHSPTPQVQIRDTTSVFESPLLHPDLNSLPVETPCLQAATADIKKYALDQNTKFDTPACEYVVQMTRTLKRSLAKNRSLSKQLSNLQEIVSAQKQSQSGKHIILCSQIITATSANFNLLHKAEQDTKARNLKNKKTHPPLGLRSSAHRTAQQY